MAFVNEHISREDVLRYDLEAVDKKFYVGATNSRNWTIDREREIYLRTVTRGREEYRSESGWTFLWNGELVYLELKLLELTGPEGGTRWAHWKLQRIELPADLMDRRAELLADLEDALVARKDGGVYAKATAFTVALDV